MLDMNRIAAAVHTIRDTELGSVCGEVASQASDPVDKETALRLRQAATLLTIAAEKMEAALMIYSIEHDDNGEALYDNF